jgi:hypothetical protein
VCVCVCVFGYTVWLYPEQETSYRSTFVDLRMVSLYLLGDPGAGRIFLTEPEVLDLSVGMLLIAGTK